VTQKQTDIFRVTRKTTSWNHQVLKKKHDFRLPPQRWLDMCSSGILRGVGWWLFTDVSGQRIGPIFKGQVLTF
jgi:hypothetical protein